MKNLDAYYDGLLAKHNEDYEYDPPWTVTQREDEYGIYYVLVDEDGNDHEAAHVFDTVHEAQSYANTTNKKAFEDAADDYL